MVKRYDLIFSIGEACSCTQALRDSGLQIYSNPLDWLYGSDYIGRCKILASKFEHFIEIEDLEYAHSERSISCDAYHNKYNDLIFNHDFFMNRPLNDTYPKVREKYNRRINRLLMNIESRKSILIVYVETPTTNHSNISDEIIKEGYDIIKNNFSNKSIDLLYIKNSKDGYKKEALTSNITRITTYYKSKNESDFDYVVNMKNLTKELNDIRLNLPILYHVKKKILKILINFLPKKSLRHSLRKKYHV